MNKYILRLVFSDPVTYVLCAFLLGKQTGKEKTTIKVITSDLIREIRFVM